MRIAKSHVALVCTVLIATILAVLSVQGYLYYTGLRRSPKDPGDQFVAAYMTLQSADKSRLAGRPWSGLRDDTDAYLRLRALRASHPDWQPQIVTYRLGRTRSKWIASAKSLVGISAPRSAATPPPPAPSLTIGPPPRGLRGGPRLRAPTPAVTPTPEAQTPNSTVDFPSSGLRE